MIKMLFRKIVDKVKHDVAAVSRKEFLIFSVLSFVCLVAPSFLYSICYSNYNFRIDFIFWLVLVFALFMAGAKTKLNLFVISIFAVMELIQFSHIFYFGTPITPFEIEMIWQEKGEIFESGFDTFPYFLIPLFSVLIPYITLFFVYLKRRKSKGSVFFSILLLIMLSILPKKALTGGRQVINNLMPRNDSISIYNSLTSFSGFFFNRVLLGYGKNTQIKDYKPYEVKKISSPKNVNVVVIIGESANPSRVHLLGHDRPTTPNLDRLAKSDRNFVYGLALSSSVLTTVSTTMFMNVLREPNNIKHLMTQPSHLFKLAKTNGFKTVYISAQDNAIARGFAPDFVDILHTKEYAPVEDAKKGDLVVLDKLKEFGTKFGSKNFIVLHQRNAHSPYDKGYRNIERFKKYVSPITASFEEKKRNSYDNAMLFNDYFISEVIDYFRKNTSNPTYIFWIPDHADLLGEDGLWGHSIVNINVAKIPFVFTLLHKENDPFVSELKSIFMPTHYEFGKMIAKLLGYEIVNPNEKDGIFYVNGNVINGDAGWFEIDKRERSFKFAKHNPD